ncbi:MAG: hypothetical protein ACLGH4_02305 [Actinomycetes bacterium]
MLPLALACAAGKGPSDLLFTTRSGHQLHASAVKRSVACSRSASGRRIHDLRHIAACLRLAKGVDPVNVQAWLGRATKEPGPPAVFLLVGRGFGLVELRGFEPLTFSNRQAVGITRIPSANLAATR